METKRFWEYELTADLLCLGERIKKGTFRPSLKTIPSTQISGALNYHLGRRDIWAIGYLTDCGVEYCVQAPRDHTTGVSKVPLTIEVLRAVTGKVFIEGWNERPPLGLSLALGALRSKGFGRTQLRYKQSVEPKKTIGKLLSRLPECEAEKVGIDQIIRPTYGYLYMPRRTEPAVYSISGYYVRALLEGSIVDGFDFVVKPEEV